MGLNRDGGRGGVRQGRVGKRRRRHTRANQPGNVAVAGDPAGRDLLHGAVDGVEEGLGLVGAGHHLQLQPRSKVYMDVAGKKFFPVGAF